MEAEDSKSALVTIDERGLIQSVDKNCCLMFGCAVRARTHSGGLPFFFSLSMMTALEP
jgi:hypothetical protein